MKNQDLANLSKATLFLKSLQRLSLWPETPIPTLRIQKKNDPRKAVTAYEKILSQMDPSKLGFSREEFADYLEKCIAVELGKVESLASIYDKHAALFAKMPGGCTQPAARTAQQLLDLTERRDLLTSWYPHLGASTECSVLDAGCNSGGLCEQLKAKRPKWEFSGFDVSSEALKVARKRRGVFKNLFQAALPHGLAAVPDDSYDIVTAAATSRENRRSSCRELLG